MGYTEAAYEGLAWPVTVQGGRLLSVAGNAGLAQFDSSVTETISKVHAHVDQVVSGASLRCIVRSQLDQPVVTDRFAPNNDVFDDPQSWEQEDGDTTDIYLSVEEDTLDTSDWVKPTSTTAGWRANYNTSGGLTTTDPVIGEVRIHFVMEVISGTGELNVRASTLGKQVSSGAISPTDGQVTIEAVLTDEDSDVSESDITDLSSGINTFVEFDNNEASADIRVYQVWLEVDSQDGPLGDGTATVQDAGWVAFDIGSWSKADATEYYIVVNKTNADGRCVWPLLDSGAECPHVSWVSRIPTMDGSLIESVSDTADAVHPIVLETDTGAVSVDSQPYARLSREPVHSGRTVEQEVTPGSSLTAGWVRLVAACHPDTADDLVAEVRKRSDDSVVGTLNVAPDDLPDPDSPRKLQQVDGPLDSTGSVDTTQHYVHLSSTEPSGTGWEVAVLDADAPPVSAESAGFGGTTDRATIDGTEDDDLDAPVVFAARPSAPSGFTASAGSGAGEADLSWTTTSLGGSFDRYLVWRGDHVIAEITDESITALTDTGALQGVEETWAIQVQDTDGIVSAKATDTATASVLSDGSHRVTSLHDPAVNLSIRAAADQMTWRFPDRVSQQRQMGRDGHRVLRAEKGKGEVLEITANLGVGQPEQDRDLFDGLLALRDADVPHLTLTTIWGHRMLCAVRVEEGSERQIADWGQATVRLVSLGDRPTPAIVGTT